MNVANRELCRDLFQLSTWGKAETHLTYYDGDVGETEPWERDADNRKCIPAYDLGYLLRKLGNRHIELKCPYVNSEPINLWSCMTLYDDGEELPAYLIEASNTPEDAVCKLAIALFQLGILSKEKRR